MDTDALLVVTDAFHKQGAGAGQGAPRGVSLAAGRGVAGRHAKPPLFDGTVPRGTM
ncbi:hypothetical protein PR002_g7259 [Phytophthora rubi]|uniref:Uncharacterized protein n=1 Tax=Phytophthora rubi TaxID=129364 RepID=A0A6A3MSD5_9STRA|nr:hypothetical protein PR002_g7259 [Phytophthora rubi]